LAGTRNGSGKIVVGNKKSGGLRFHSSLRRE
jgi:hypothetical protein